MFIEPNTRGDQSDQPRKPFSRQVIDGTHLRFKSGMDAILNAKDSANKKVRSARRNTHSAIVEQPLRAVFIASAIGASLALLAVYAIDFKKTPQQQRLTA